MARGLLGSDCHDDSLQTVDSVDLKVDLFGLKLFFEQAKGVNSFGHLILSWARVGSAVNESAKLATIQESEVSLFWLVSTFYAPLQLWSVKKAWNLNQRALTLKKKKY